jgi:ATP-dependent RNA helicase DDX27
LEEDAEMRDEGALKAAIRSAKRSARPTKIGVPDGLPSKSSKTKDKKSGRKKMVGRSDGVFDRDLGQHIGRGEGVRVKKGDAIAGMGKKGGFRGRKTK